MLYLILNINKDRTFLLRRVSTFMADSVGHMQQVVLSLFGRKLMGALV